MACRHERGQWTTPGSLVPRRPRRRSRCLAGLGPRFVYGARTLGNTAVSLHNSLGLPIDMLRDGHVVNSGRAQLAR